MIEQYELYCLADRLFYDTLNQQRTEHKDFMICGRPVPEEWDHVPSDTWMFYAPQERSLPPQGWKIHVSSCLDDAERVVTSVWDYCVPRGIAFKFLRNRPVVMMLNSKAAFRGSSGKLLTIYPTDEGQLELVLKELDVILSGVAGPYILSDLRYGVGPLFVRYGGFAERHCLSESGERVLALSDGEGRLVPDVRGPTFALPPWVTLPGFLEPHLAARNSVTTTGLPYQIESVLQFSNGGGVYLGRDLRTQERVVLKEGRPHAGLDVAGRDAVTRLSHERDILERLAGLDVVPALLDYFTLGDHHFLVEEFVDGNPLQRQLVHRYPLTHPDCSQQALADYAEWALDMITKVERAAGALHERGVVFGDLHPQNVLVTAEGRLVLIDFEVSTLAEDRVRSTLAHPGFGAPEGWLGVDVDRYAIACLHLGMFAPQTTIMLSLHPAKIVQLADLVTELFPVSADPIARAVQTILGPVEARPSSATHDLPMPGRADWPQVRDAMCTAILASATPDRDDRLFPGDIKQFQPGGGINVAYGAAGVLYALAVTDAVRSPQHEDWLRKHALSPDDGIGAGFYDGLHGVAHVLETLGHRQDALDTIDLCLRVEWESGELGLYSGLAGIGLNLLHFGELTGEPALSDLAHRIVDMTADRLGGVDDVPEISGGDNPHAGLMYGSAGPALLFLRAYEQTGDAALLDHAALALRQDLRRCTWGEDGTLQVDQGWRTLPYLDEGSVGIGLVLARYLTHREDEDFAAALSGLQSVARSGYFVQPGLFAGRSSMIASRGMTSRAAGTLSQGGSDPEMADLIRWLSWHALPYGGGLAFAGDQLLRLSMDFATGTAGVLFALGAALRDRPVFLPFFEPPERKL
ncbi:MAG: class III lanthionine synthetase LanKC [Pseudonocardiaceae bacterium]